MSILSTAFHWTSEKPAAEPSRIGSLAQALLREIRIRRALREARALDEAALFDMGLQHGGLEDAVRHGRR